MFQLQLQKRTSRGRSGKRRRLCTRTPQGKVMKTVATSVSFVRLTNTFLNTCPVRTSAWIMSMDRACTRGLKQQKGGGNVKLHMTLPTKQRGTSNSKTATSRRHEVVTTIGKVIPNIFNPALVRILTCTVQTTRQPYKLSCCDKRRGSRLWGAGDSFCRTHSPGYRRSPLRFLGCLR